MSGTEVRQALSTLMTFALERAAGGGTEEQVLREGWGVVMATALLHLDGEAKALEPLHGTAMAGRRYVDSVDPRILYDTVWQCSELHGRWRRGRS